MSNQQQNEQQTSTIVLNNDKDAQFMVKVDLTEESIFKGISFQTDSSENQQYLEQKLLGVLMPSLQHLIHRYYDKPNAHLLEPNPINYLAMELMRNHPKYRSSSLEHPYVQKLLQKSTPNENFK